jgi:hypothetical protein
VTTEEKTRRWHQLAHALQSGIEYSKNEFEREHKHLRVGISTAHVDHSALASLLIKKGIITQEEYLDALVEAMETEVKRVEAELSIVYGAKITLG